MSGEELISAGTAALERGQWEAARTAFQAALRHAETGEARAGLGEALWWLGDLHGSVDNHTRAYAVFRRSDDPGHGTAAVVAALQLCTLHLSSYGNEVVAGGWLARAERLVADTEPGPLAAWVLLTRAHLDREAEPAQRLVEQARRDHDVDLELCALAAAGLALVARGEVARGLALTDEAMAGTLGGEYHRLDTVVFTSCDMLHACELAADLQRATQWCRVADAFVAEYGSPYLHAHCRARYGAVLLACGDWAAADAQLTTAVATAQAAPRLHAKALSHLADLRLRQGRLEEAEALLSSCHDQQAVAVAAAAARLAHGQPAAAGAILQRHLDSCGGGPVETAPALAILVQVHLARGDLPAARTVASALTDLAASSAHPLFEARAAMAAGSLAAAVQEVATAINRLDRARELFGRLDLPYESARAQRELAAVLAGTRPDAAIAELERALGTFRRLGATPEADATASLLRSLGVSVRPPPAGRTTLTDREAEVLALLGHGLSNPEIARRLFISRKTVSHHVSNVLAKLDLHNRAEAAAYSTRHVDPRTARRGST